MVLTKLLTKIVGDPNEKELDRLMPTVEHINQIEAEYQKTLKLEDVPAKTDEFKKRLAEKQDDPETQKEVLETLLPEAFALVKFTCRQLMGNKWDVRGNDVEWNMIPYDVQLLGGIVLHHGKNAEMKTGEGKTLVCTMPVYLNGLTGKGAHVVTVNEYLAHRDAEWMGGLYRALGLTVGVIAHGQNPEEKRAAYNADVTYGTNNEFGFDYLRDNMARSIETRVQRKCHYAIVDEVDSILIDEARTPLIISAPAEESTEKYQRYSGLIDKLEENTHYNIDEKAKTAVLSEEGIKKMEEVLGVDNIYTDAGFQEVHHIEQALKAKTVYQRDTDYVVKDGEVMIVDEFTGRLMPGRRYSHGLHQAIEAKENVEIKRESKTLATITFQNYFRLYNKLAGMTGTAITEAEEFSTIYGLETLVVPTNVPVVREDLADVVYKDTQGKYMAIAKKVKELNEKGQPVLIGTVSVEKSEMLSKLLTTQGIKHNVLNAKHHQQEAEIIANAGQNGAATIATNMAGRGTDIKLGEGVVDLGGLYVIGTERHESRRIDNQLRGRSGRQGDPGTTQFYLCMEDDLMRLFGSERIKSVMETLKVPDDMPIENRLISRSIEGAQKKVEGRNFDIRKHLVEYDDVMNKHREIMYKRRNEVLENEDLKEEIQAMIDKEANDTVMSHATMEGSEKWDYKEIAETLNNLPYDASHKLNESDLHKHEKSEELVEVAQKFLRTEYAAKEKQVPSSDIMRQVERAIALRVVDTLWMEHIDEMSKLRERVALRGYGQRDPLIEYKNEAFTLFAELDGMIQGQVVSTLFKVRVRQAEEQAQMAPALPTNVKTNEAEMKRVTQSVQKSTFEAPTVIKADDEPAPKKKTAKSKPASKEKITVVSADDPTPGMPTAPPEPKEPEEPSESTAPSEPPEQVVAGAQPAAGAQKVGRNDPCPCGNGKKYKKCCGKN